MSRVSALFRLQEIDLELDACRARLGEIKAALGDDPAIQQARSRWLSAETRQRAARVILQELELETLGLAEKIREAEQRLYSGAIRNPKELRDLQAEVESLKRRLAATEEQQLNALIESEVAETVATGTEVELHQVEDTAARAQTALRAERETLEGRLRKLEAEREAASAPVPAADRQVYDRLRQTRHGRAVTRLEDGACAACGIAASALIRQEARRATELVRCAGCDRILYAD
jgi:predicted  nucleic acid-binding Zn-ribbon protein